MFICVKFYEKICFYVFVLEFIRFIKIIIYKFYGNFNIKIHYLILLLIYLI